MLYLVSMEKVVGGNEKEYLKKVEIKGRVNNLYNTLSKSLPSFLMHYFIKQKQSKFGIYQTQSK